MTDEKYVFTQDVREKRITARSARSKRTHNGKGGRAKFPSDHMTKKELQAMNGEVKSYRLNDPMAWDEFKAMPDDLKITYIKLLRERFDVPDYKIGEMMGANKDQIWVMFKKLGLNGTSKRKRKDWNSEGWFAFVNGIPVPAADPVENALESVEAAEEPAERQMVSLEDICEPKPVPEVKVLPVREDKPKAIPNSGNLTFVGSAEAALNTLSVLLGGAKVSLCVSWEVCPQEGACEA